MLYRNYILSRMALTCNPNKNPDIQNISEKEILKNLYAFLNKYLNVVAYRRYYVI